jgi:hypothetical protein
MKKIIRLTESDLTIIVKKILIEGNESEDKFINKILNVLDIPYFKNLKSMGIDKGQYEDIFSNLYNQPVSVKYDINDNGIVYDSLYNDLYYENIGSNYWEKREFDENGKQIYYEDSNGYWTKREYGENGNEIYYEDSKGTIEDYRRRE